MYSLAIHADAKADLDDLRTKTPDVATRVLAILQEIQGDQRLLDSLLDHGFGENQTEKFHVNKWVELWKKQIDIWRLRIWDLLPEYRVIYAYDIQNRCFYVLGVLPREFDYDINDARSKRILQAYTDLFN